MIAPDVKELLIRSGQAFVVAAVVLCVGFCSPWAWAADADEPETWCGLVVAPENRCSPYERRRDYRYPASIERDILGARRGGFSADRAGNINKPFPSEYQHGVTFSSLRDTDIEHRVPCAEAHDSGLCAADRATRRRFARDLENLTIADWRLNRFQKSDQDPSDWMPRKNPVAYAAAWIHIKRKYELTVDAAEADALADVIWWCPR